jgi:hypothetical protein
MKRILTAVLAISFALTLTPAHAGITTWRDTECRYQYLDGHRGWSTWEVKKTIECATQKWGVSTSTALYVADRESHFGQYATNATSGACGVFQHLPRYFPSRLASVKETFGPFGGSCYNARDNVLAAIWLARSGWSPWSL